MEIYADKIFFTNFIFDFGILITLLKISGQKIRILRLMLSACLGGVQGVFVFIPYFRILGTPPMRFILPLVMTAIVFMPCGFGELIKNGMLFFITAFVLSGAACFFGLNSYIGMNLPYPFYFAANYLHKKGCIKAKKITLIYKGKRYDGTGFYDSGNMMYYKNIPVILANNTVFEEMFGKGFNINAAQEWIDEKDIRPVAYSSPGGCGVLIGIKLDNAVVGRKNYGTAILACCRENLDENVILNRVMI